MRISVSLRLPSLSMSSVTFDSSDTCHFWQICYLLLFRNVSLMFLLMNCVCRVEDGILCLIIIIVLSDNCILFFLHWRQILWRGYYVALIVHHQWMLKILNENQLQLNLCKNQKWTSQWHKFECFQESVEAG